MTLTLADASTVLWLVKSHWSNFAVLDGEKQTLQAGAWLDVIGDLDLPAIRAALAQHNADGHDFPPTAGQVREIVLSSRGDTAPDWDQAYVAILDSIRRFGSSRGPQWGANEGLTRDPLHPAIEAAVLAIGGWPTVGQSEHTDAFRAQLRDLYRSAAGRHDREAKRPPGARALGELAAGLADALALPAGPA